jgi:hypothetical protein
VAGKKRRLAGNCLNDRDTVLRSERGEFGLGERIVHASASNNHGTLRGLEQGDSGSELVEIGPWPWAFVNYDLKERFRIVVCLCRNVLG